MTAGSLLGVFKQDYRAELTRFELNVPKPEDPALKIRKNPLSAQIPQIRDIWFQRGSLAGQGVATRPRRFSGSPDGKLTSRGLLYPLSMLVTSAISPNMLLYAPRSPYESSTVSTSQYSALFFSFRPKDFRKWSPAHLSVN